MTNKNLRSLIEAKEVEIFEITPVILGGDPIDPENKVLLSRRQHIEAVCYWNKIIKKIKKEKEKN